MEGTPPEQQEQTPQNPVDASQSQGAGSAQDINSPHAGGEDNREENAPVQNAPNLEKADPVAGAEQVQEQVDADEKAGYRGTTPDPTPNSHYTVEGVVAGKPTPETDPDARAAALSSVQGPGKLAGG